MAYTVLMCIIGMPYLLIERHASYITLNLILISFVALCARTLKMVLVKATLL